MFFTRDKLDPVHHSMKQMEVEFGIITQVFHTLFAAE